MTHKEHKLINFVSFRQNLSEYVSLAKYASNRVVVTRNGKPVGAFVSIEDLKIIEEMEYQRDIKAFDAGMKDIKKHGTVSLEEVKKQLSTDVSDTIQQKTNKKTKKISTKRHRNSSSKN